MPFNEGTADRVLIVSIITHCISIINCLQHKHLNFVLNHNLCLLSFLQENI